MVRTHIKDVICFFCQPNWYREKKKKVQKQSKAFMDKEVNILIQIFEFISCTRPCYRLWYSKERTKTKKLVLMETVPGLKDLRDVKNKHSLTRDEFTRLTIEFSNTEQPRVPGYSSTLTVSSIMGKVDPLVSGKTYLAVFPYHKRHSFLKFLLACLHRNTHWVTPCKSQHPNLLPSVK